MNRKQSMITARRPGQNGLSRWAGRVALLAITLAVGACATTGNYADPNAVWAKNGSENVNRVEVEPAPSGAQTTGGLEISLSQLRSALAELRFETGEGEVLPVFTDKALEKIAKPLSRGLGQLQPGQDLVFRVTQKRSDKIYNFFMDPKLTTGRVFVTDQGLNIIFGRIDLAFEGTYRATNVLADLNPGRRDKPAGKAWSVLESKFVDYAKPGRDDWIVIEPKAWLMAEPPMAAPDETGAQPATGAAQPGNQYYQPTRERLQAIKKLREDGLISEQEYQELRSRILSNLAE